MPPAVDPAVLDPAVRVLLRSQGRDRDEPRPYAADRPAVSGNALLRRAADAGVQQMTRPLHNEGHAVNVTRSRRLMRLMRLMPMRRKPAASRPAPGRKTYPYPLGGRRAGRATRPGRVRRHRRSADAAGLPLPGRRHGPVPPQAAGLAHLEHAGGGFLRCGPERGGPPLWPTRDHERRSSFAVHVLRLG